MKKNDKTYLRRIEGGPNREDLFDALRLGGEVDHLDLVFLSNHFKQRPRNIKILDLGRVYENCNDTWRIKFPVPYMGIFEAFYSTSTRSGYVCRAEEITNLIFPSCVVPAYRPLTNYQIMCLLQLASISRHTKLVQHIKARLVRGIKGIIYPEPQLVTVKPRIRNLIRLFDETWEGPKSEELVLEFREIMNS